MRLRCKIFGCVLGKYDPACVRCGSWLYDWSFIGQESSLLAPWYEFKWWFVRNRDWFQHRCGTCNKKMFFSEESCCSQKCYDNWCPF